jgi:cation/acetate symporter
VVTTVFMLCYVLFGGMLATTWVQIIKAVLLLIGVGTMVAFLLVKVSFDPGEILSQAATKSGEGDKFLGPGLFFHKPLNTISTGVAFALGTAGLPHILMRFFTVRDARAARGSVAWAVLLIGIFYVMVSLVGFGSRAVLGTGAVEEVGKSGNLAAPLLAQSLGGGANAGGDIFFAVISGVAFATILAVVAGLVIAASGGVAHDLYNSVIKHGQATERQEVMVGRIAAVGVAGVAIVLALLAGPAFNIQFLVGLAFSVAASANFPALLLAILWRRFNTTGAVVGVASGLIASVTLIILSPAVWPGPDHEGGPFPLSNPAIVSIPLGFLGCYVGTLLGSPEGQRSYDELRVRAETGIGSEGSGVPADDVRVPAEGSGVPA